MRLELLEYGVTLAVKNGNKDVELSEKAISRCLNILNRAVTP